MDKGKVFEEFGVYRYNTYWVVADRDDKNDPDSPLALLLTNNIDLDTDIKPPLVEGTTTTAELIENKESNDLLDLTLGDSYQLMLGLLIKSEKFFTKNQSRSAEDADFNEKVILIKDHLITSCTQFGYKVTENTNGALLLQNDNKVDDNNKTYIEETSIKCLPQEQDENPENSKESSQQKTKRNSRGKSFSSKDAKKQQKLKPVSSKKEKASYVFYDKRMINTAAKLRCSRTRENFQSVVNTLKEAALNKTTSEGRTRNRKLSKSFHFDKKVINDRDVSRRSISMSGLLRRSLFQPSKWLETFHQIHSPPK